MRVDYSVVTALAVKLSHLDNQYHRYSHHFLFSHWNPHLLGSFEKDWESFQKVWFGWRWLPLLGGIFTGALHICFLGVIFPVSDRNGPWPGQEDISSLWTGQRNLFLKQDLIFSVILWPFTIIPYPWQLSPGYNLVTWSKSCKWRLDAKFIVFSTLHSGRFRVVADHPWDGGWPSLDWWLAIHGTSPNPNFVSKV